MHVLFLGGHRLKVIVILSEAFWSKSILLGIVIGVIVKA